MVSDSFTSIMASLQFLGLCSFVSFLSGYIFYRLSKRIYRIYTSPLRTVPGPPAVSILYGSFDLIPEADAYRLFERWTRQWGPTFRYSSTLKSNRLHTSDIKALNHILSSDSYVKSNILLRFSPAFSLSIGKGLLFVEGIRHQQLRRIMNTAFSYPQIREFTEIFFRKSIELRDIWSSATLVSGRPDGKLEIDALAWMNKVSLDTIGLAGFDYNFDSLHASTVDETPNELLQAVRDLFSFEFLTPIFLIQLFFPLARIIPTERSRVSAKCIDTIQRIGNEMVVEKKTSLLRQLSGNVGRKDIRERDLLSLLIKNNLAADVPEEERMTDAEICSQIPSVLLAGHETSAATLAWTLFSLAVNPEVQKKLREELSSVRSDVPTMDQLLALPYLDAVIREALRLHAPVAFTERVVIKSDIIPLDTPYVDIKGVMQNTVRVSKGDKVYIPIRAVNRSKELWGADAEDFRPERWTEKSVPEGVRAIPSVWSNTMSFLSGSHACIGYKVALVQMKAILYTVVRGFYVQQAISPEDIGRRNNIVGRPYICSDPQAGSQLPLLILPVKEA